MRGGVLGGTQGITRRHLKQCSQHEVLPDILTLCLFVPNIDSKGGKHGKTQQNTLQHTLIANRTYGKHRKRRVNGKHGKTHNHLPNNVCRSQGFQTKTGSSFPISIPDRRFPSKQSSLQCPITSDLRAEATDLISILQETRQPFNNSLIPSFPISQQQIPKRIPLFWECHIIGVPRWGGVGGSDRPRALRLCAIPKTPWRCHVPRQTQ